MQDQGDRENEERRQEEEKERLRKFKEEETNHIIKVITTTYECMSKRHASIRDPATRYALIVDKLCMAVDFAIGGMNLILKDADQEHKDMALNTATLLQKDLINLMDWIQSPTYSPDHPIGKNDMDEAKQSFDDHEK